jgi:hypothetical protein
LKDSGDDAEAGCDYEDFDMGEEEFGLMLESRRKEHEEIAAILEKMRKDKEDPLLHYEGDTDIEDIFVDDDEPAADQAPNQANQPVPEDKKTRKLSVKRKGPTQRSHCSVVIDDGPDYKPTSDDDKMCFRDVHQFRHALINLHIAQNRNFHYHRNSNVRIIVDCLKENCPFYMVASEIKNEKTFVIRK